MFNKNTIVKDIDGIINANPDIAGKIDINKAITSEVNGVIDYGLWLETIQIQRDFNNRVASGWERDSKQQKFNYWLAILDETLEVLTSRHWKWWKDSSKLNEVDWENVKVEMVDLFHFILSIGIQTKSEDLIFTALLGGEVEVKSDVRPSAQSNPDRFFSDFWDRFLISVQMKAFPMIVVLWVEFWTRLGFNTEDLFREYRVKAALNIVRQEFGYGSKNTYNKLWVNPASHENDLVEDNVAAYYLTKDIGDEINENSTGDFIKILRTYYLQNSI